MKSLYLSLTLVCLVGCGPGFTTEKVTGKVTLDGQAIEGAAVTFQPVEGGTGMPAVGTTDANGAYTITDMRGGDFGTGAVAGEYRVGVMWFKPSGVDLSQATGESGGSEEDGDKGDSKAARTKISGPDSALPAAYQNPTTSTLTATVVAGENEFNFELDSKFKPAKK